MPETKTKKQKLKYEKKIFKLEIPLTLSAHWLSKSCLHFVEFKFEVRQFKLKSKESSLRLNRINFTWRFKFL